MAPQTDDEVLIDAAELADALAVTIHCVYRLSASGRVPRYKLGHRTVRFKLSEVLEALRADAAALKPGTGERSPRPPRHREAPPAPDAPRFPLPPFDWSKPS